MSTIETLGHVFTADARFGGRAVAGRFGAACLVLAFLATLFRFLTLQEDGSFADVSFMDCLASLFGGMSEFDPKHDDRFNLPASWLCVCLMGGFVVLSYPAQNLESIGVKQCIEARGRWCWWISKCLWTVMCAFAYWFAAIVIALLMAGDADLALSPGTGDLLGFFVAKDCSAYLGTNELLVFVAGIPLALSALYLVQLAVSVNTNPLAAFVLTTALLFFAAYYLNGTLLGNYLMLARSNLVIYNGVDAGSGIALSLVVSLGAVLAGGRAFARHDILGKEKYSA